MHAHRWQICLFHVPHIPWIYFEDEKEMKSFLLLGCRRILENGDSERSGRFIESICLFIQTSIFLKEKAHTCLSLLYASKYNENVYYDFVAYHWAIGDFSSAEFSSNIRRNQWNLSSSQLHLKFIYFVLLFTLLLPFFILLFNCISTGREWPYLLHPLSLAVCTKIFNFPSFLF